MQMQQLSRDIKSIRAYCDLKVNGDGKVVLVERPGTTWKQQWDIDRFRAIMASDARAKEVVRQYIQETIEVLRENSGRSDENLGQDAGQKIVEQKPAPASPSKMRSMQPASPTPVLRQAGRAVYNDEPTPVEIDIADAMLSFIAGQSGPASEDDILAAIDADEHLKRKVFYRLAIDQILEPLKGGMYRIPDWPPKSTGLPDHCPAKKGGQAIGNCVLAAPLLGKLVKEKIVSPSTGCPLRRVCGPTR